LSQMKSWQTSHLHGEGSGTRTDLVSYTETTRLRLPPSLEVVEAPEPTSASESFGDFSVAVRREAEVLVIERRLTLRCSLLQPADYERVRGFFEKWQRAERRPVLLRQLGVTG
jgi:hypothetical protein